MGSSQGVRDKMKDANQDWVKLIKQEQQSMDDTMKDFVDSFDPFVEDFYKKNKWDQKLFGQEKKTDLQESLKFSFEQIGKTISDMADLLMKGDLATLFDAPPDKGKEASKGDIDKVKGALAAFVAPAPSLIVTAATATIQLVLGLFDETGQGNISKAMTSHRVAPGMMLHAYAYSSLGSADTVIEGSRIKMSAIGFRLIYSFAQNAVEQDITFMASMTKQKQEVESTLQTMQKILDAMLMDPEADDKKIENYSKRLDLVRADLEKYQKMIDDRSKAFVHAVRLRRLPAA